MSRENPAKFFQEPIKVDNVYAEDHYVQRVLNYLLPSQVLSDITPDLVNFGRRCATDIMDMAQNAKANEPVLQQYDSWGKRVDIIHTSEGWRQLHDVAAQEGIVSIGYERRYGADSRLYQFTKLYLFNPSSSIYTCPMAMTDGATRLLELHGSEEEKREIIPRLISRDPKYCWTSGQWMTERTGGSDVSRTETVARHVRGREYTLHGFKWFTSATDANMSLALARVEGPDDTTVKGSGGLSVFLIHMRDAQDKLNGITVCRLKEKLGTRAMPTAELELNGTVAHMVGEKGRGVATISTILNITRLYNSTCAVSCMRRALMYAADYAKRRHAFGKNIADQPLHLRTLAWLEVETRASTLLVFYCIRLLGRDEVGTATARERDLLRLLTPIAKLFTGKRAIAVTSEALECMGGAGYIEDHPLAVLLRDAQVMSIWEGTTNILSLDVLRVLAKGSSFKAFVSVVNELVASSPYKEEAAAVKKAVQELVQHATNLPTRPADFVESTARHFAFSLARTFTAALLLDFAARSGQDDDIVCARRWIAFGLVQIPTDLTSAQDRALVYPRL